MICLRFLCEFGIDGHRREWTVDRVLLSEGAEKTKGALEAVVPRKRPGRAQRAQSERSELANARVSNGRSVVSAAAF